MRSYLHPLAETRPARGDQLGVFASAGIPGGTLVTLWGGELVRVSELHLVAEDRQHFFVQIEEDWMIGPATGPVADSEYFNHSCDPTCGLSGQMGLVTMRDVEPGEELTFDYAMAELVGQPWTCSCGSPLCRGQVRDNDALIPDLQRRYAGYFSPWIARRLEPPDPWASSR